MYGGDIVYVAVRMWIRLEWTIVPPRGVGIKKRQVVRNGRKAKVTGGMSADLIPSHMVGMRGTQKHMPGRPDGALSTVCDQ